METIPGSCQWGCFATLETSEERHTLSGGHDLVGVVGILGVDLQEEVAAHMGREPQEQLDNLWLN